MHEITCMSCEDKFSWPNLHKKLCFACSDERRIESGNRKRANCGECGKAVFLGRGSRLIPVCLDCRSDPNRKPVVKAVKKRTRKRSCKAFGPDCPATSHQNCANNKKRHVALCHCGKEFFQNRNRKKYCSRECSKSAKALVPKPSRVWHWRCLVTYANCGVCGQAFVEHGGRKYCGKDCSKVAQYIKNPDRFKRNAHIRRARLLSVVIDEVKPQAVFERDKWKCHICGGKVRKVPRWKRDPEMASLDHLLPISLGGEHSLANTACSHLRCNLSKGSRSVGEQLALIG